MCRVSNVQRLMISRPRMRSLPQDFSNGACDSVYSVFRMAASFMCVVARLQMTQSFNFRKCQNLFGFLKHFTWFFSKEAAHAWLIKQHFGNTLINRNSI